MTAHHAPVLHYRISFDANINYEEESPPQSKRQGATTTFARAFSLFLLIASTILSAAVGAQEIEIKGLRIGMTKEEVERKIGPLPVRDFTIAGMRSKYPISPKFHDGKLDSFIFFFESGGFDEVASAVKEKYPDLKCDDSVVTNAMGRRSRRRDA